MRTIDLWKRVWNAEESIVVQVTSDVFGSLLRTTLGLRVTWYFQVTWNRLFHLPGLLMPKPWACTNSYGNAITAFRLEYIIILKIGLPYLYVIYISVLRYLRDFWSIFEKFVESDFRLYALIHSMLHLNNYIIFHICLSIRPCVQNIYSYLTKCYQ